jgi:GNAT superfamily N-acetyltransferase
VSRPFRVEQLNSRHDRTSFACGSPPLDRYIREQATQDVRRRVAKCFVAVEGDAARIAGFYTLAAANIPLEALPDEIKRRLPRYPTVPVVRIGRLAVDQAHRGKKLGAALLSDALLRSLNSDIGAFALIVDAKDEQAEAFYIHHGFVSFAPRQLFLPLSSVIPPSGA